MALNEDVAYLAIELLGKSKRKLSLQEMLDSIPFERRELASVLTMLHGVGLVEREKGQESEGFLYSLAQEATAYQITKAVEMGVDVSALSRWMRVSDKQKQAALALSMQSQKLRELDEQARERKSQGQKTDDSSLPRDMVVDTLERLLLASEISIEDYSKTRKDGDDILRALKTARDEAKKALQDYRKSLAAGGSGGYEDF